jgi:hypothetical protein
MRMIIWVSTAALVAVVAPHSAAPQTASTSFPMLERQSLTTAILPILKQRLRDPYSVRDFRICEARGLELKDGRLDRWSVAFGFNAKNGLGGYEGFQAWVAQFAQGQPVSLRSMKSGASDRLMAPLYTLLRRQVEQCSAVTDDDVQRMMAAPAQPVAN